MKPKLQLLKLSVLVLFIMSQNYALSQIDAHFLEASPSKNSISVLLGLHFNRSQDLVFSPNIYQGSAVPALSLVYERQAKNGKHRILLAYDNIEVIGPDLISFDLFGETRTRIPSQASQINIHYGYAHRMSKNEKLQFYLGGILEAKIHLTNYEFGVSDDEGYIFANSLHAWVAATYHVNEKSSFQAELFSPVISLVSRPEYAIVDNEEIQHDGSDIGFLYQKGELASFDKYKAINFSIGYTYELSSFTHLKLGYRLDYLRYTDPLPISVLKNNFDFGLSFNF